MNARVPVRVAGRASRAWETVAGSGVAAVLVVDPLDIRWLTGFTGSAGIVVLGPRPVLVVDGRYGEQAAEETSASGSSAEVVVAQHGSTVDDEAVRLVSGAVGFDPAVTTVARTARWRAAGAPALVEVGGFAALRMVKEPDELARIERAAAITDRALALTEVRPGATEEDVRNRLEETMRREGADGPGYGTIVASGPNSALPHHRPTSRDIRLGDAVVIDAGAEVDGYRSDMTRTTGVGAVDPILSSWWEIVAEAQEAGVAAVRPGATGDDVDRAVRLVLDRHGVGEWFVHGTGHGVGLAIHEGPWLRRGSIDVLEEGMVVTVEPGLYRRDVGGVRIEDLLVVTRTASRHLTHSPKDAPCPQSAPTT